MRIDRGLFGWGVFLVVLGAVPLAVAQGWLPSDIRWWELWPLIIVGIGVGILLRHSRWAPLGGLVVAVTVGAMAGGALSGSAGFPVFGGGCLGGAGGQAFAARSGTLSGSNAAVGLNMPCGDITLGTAAGSSWRIEGTSDGGRAPSIDASGASLTAQVDSSSGVFGARSVWKVTLPAGPRIALKVTDNAGSARLDLSGANLESAVVSINAGDGRVDLTGTTPSGLSVDVNAGSARVQLPVASFTGDLTVNAGSISLCTAPGVALRLRTNDNITAGFDYDRHGLVRSGNTWTSPGWDSATTRIDLSTTANAGSFNLDPQEGCK